MENGGRENLQEPQGEAKQELKFQITFPQQQQRSVQYINEP